MLLSLLACLPLAAADTPAGEGSDVPPVELAPDATTYTGRPIAQRSLEAPNGGLPQESLEPLLRVQQDGVYNPQDVRRDIALLYRVADFEQVEVDVEPAVAYDAEGNPIAAVDVTYRVYPPPRIDHLVLKGNRHLSRRAVLAALDLERDDAFYAEDAPSLARHLTETYARAGWPDAKVKLATEATKVPGRTDLSVEIEEGEANRIGALDLHANDALSLARMKWILARHGLRPGHVWTEKQLADGREALLDATRKAGWYEARVTAEVDATTPRTASTLAVVPDPGRRFTLDLAGATDVSAKELVTALELERGVRLTRSWGEDAGHSLTEQLHDDGYLAAETDVRLTETPGSITVTVTGARGPRHRLRHVTFTGAETEADRVWSKKYLDGAFREAATDTLKRRRITQADVDRALVAMQEFYRSQGYLRAHLERTTFAPAPAGKRRSVPVDVTIQVAAGPRATLRDVQVADAAEGIDAQGPFDDLVGKPLNPAEIDARTRRLVEAHAERGYLDADAHAKVTVSEDGTSADVTVQVRTGPVVYLRSVLIRGYRRTRRLVLEREVDLAAGDPLVPSRVEDIRRRLYDLGMFNRVDVTPSGDEDRVKDLLITVEEKQNLHFEAGGGIATDQGVKLFLRAGHRNLFGLGHRLTAYGQVGIGWVGDGWTPDWAAPEWRAALRYEAAHVPTRGERLAVDILFNEQQQQPLYRLQRSGGGIGLLLRLGAHGRAEFGYKVQFRELLDVDPGVLIANDPWLNELGVTDLADPQPRLPSAVRAQSGLGLDFVADLRDDPFNPHKGGIGTLSFDLADRLLTDVSFLRMEGSWTSYVPFDGFLALFRLRGGIGLLPDANTALPLEDRFVLGGGATFRGFALDSMGPANLVSQEKIDYGTLLGPLLDYSTRGAPARWVPTGGDSMGVLTAELWIPFEKLGLASWSGTNVAVFTDIGNVWLVSNPSATSSQVQGTDPLLRWSLGIGLRRSTVVGPIQVDVGFNPQRLTDRGETLARVHLSLGAL